MIEYYLAAEPASDMSLTIMEAGGEIIQRFSSQSDDSRSPPAEAGTNRFIWDMRYSGNQLPLSAGALPEYEYYGPPSRPVAPPGQYIAMLTVDGQTVEQRFRDTEKSGAAASDADLRAQFELMIDIRDRVNDVSDLVIKTREVRARIASGAGRRRNGAATVGRHRGYPHDVDGFRGPPHDVWHPGPDPETEQALGRGHRGRCQTHGSDVRGIRGPLGALRIAT